MSCVWRNGCNFETCRWRDFPMVGPAAKQLDLAALFAPFLVLRFMLQRRTGWVTTPCSYPASASSFVCVPVCVMVSGVCHVSRVKCRVVGCAHLCASLA